MYSGFNPITFLGDIVACFILIYCVLRALLWWTSRPFFMKSKHIYSKSLFYGILAAIVAIFNQPPGRFITSIITLLSFLVVTLIAYVVLIIRLSIKK